MQNFIFQNATKVYFGKGCVKEYLACLLRGSQRVLLAYGGGSIKKTGLYDRVVAEIERAGLTLFELSGIEPQPPHHLGQQGG